MQSEYILVEQSKFINGTVELVGAKNSVLVIMISLILAPGKSKLKNVPFSEDVFQMIHLLETLGAKAYIDQENNSLEIDTSNLNNYKVSSEIMKKMRASILVMGPLLARLGKVEVGLPGGDMIGKRPVDFHLKGFARMGAEIHDSPDLIKAHASKLKPMRFVLEYPSVGATENIMMAAVLTLGKTEIINAAIEPEILDLISILKKMGAQINIVSPAIIEIIGVSQLHPVEHTIMYDRLEAGSLLLAAAITGGQINLPQAPADSMDVFLDKLSQMGHSLQIGPNGVGVNFQATKNPKAVSFKTMPYPGFPTDLQAPMIAALCLSDGESTVCETVYENRLLHVPELQKMGAQIKVDGTTAIIKGVDELYGTRVIATDIRAAYSLVLAGLAAQGKTKITGVHHLKRGYENIDQKLNNLGAKISFKCDLI